MGGQTRYSLVVTNVGWDVESRLSQSFDNPTFSLNDCFENWVHVAYSHDNNANSKLYINGQPVDTINALNFPASQMYWPWFEFNNTRFYMEVDDFDPSRAY